MEALTTTVSVYIETSVTTGNVYSNSSGPRNTPRFIIDPGIADKVRFIKLVVIPMFVNWTKHMLMTKVYGDSARYLRVAIRQVGTI